MPTIGSSSWSTRPAGTAAARSCCRKACTSSSCRQPHLSCNQPSGCGPWSTNRWPTAPLPNWRPWKRCWSSGAAPWRLIPNASPRTPTSTGGRQNHPHECSSDYPDSVLGICTRVFLGPSTRLLDISTSRADSPTPSLRTELRALVGAAAAGIGEVHTADGVLPGEGLRVAVPVTVVVGPPEREVHVGRAHKSGSAWSGDLAEDLPLVHRRARFEPTREGYVEHGHRVAVVDVDRDATGVGIGPAHDAGDRRVDRLARRVPIDAGQIERVLVLVETVLVLVRRAVVALHDRPLTPANRPDDPARTKLGVGGRCGAFHLAFRRITVGPIIPLQIGRRDLEELRGDPADLLAVLHLIEALLRSRQRGQRGPSRDGAHDRGGCLWSPAQVDIAEGGRRQFSGAALDSRIRGDERCRVSRRLLRQADRRGRGLRRCRECGEEISADVAGGAVVPDWRPAIVRLAGDRHRAAPRENAQDFAAF